METTKRTIIMLLLALLTTGATQSVAVSNTRTASCLVKITCDSAILPLNSDTIDYLLHSSGVGGKAARQILDVSSDQVRDFFIIEYVQELISDVKSKSSKGGSSGMEGGMDEYEYAMMMEAEIGMSMMDPMGPKSLTRFSRGGPRTRRNPSTGRTITASDLSADEQTFLFSLHIELPEQVKPLAKEFMNALVENLRQALTNAYNEYEDKLENMLQFAESRCDRARSQLAKAMEQTKAKGSAPVIEQDPIDAFVYEQLGQIVDLQNLTPSTSFADVIEQLKTVVDPPLQIQPNWKDLLENGEVEQTTPAGMDPLTGIKLRKALEILLDGVSGDFAELKYVVDEGVVLIGTEDALSNKLVPLVYEIPALSHSAGGAKDLIDTIQNTIDPESWFDMSDIGEATITPYPSHQPRKLAILQTYENHQKIQKFLESIKVDIPVGMPLEVPEGILLSEKNNLLAEKRNLEMELARLESRIPAVEGQIKRIQREIDEKVNADQVSLELKSILAMQVKYLEGVKKLVDNGSMSSGELADAEQKLARAKIELAMRREQIGASAGTDQLVKFSNELATLAIDTAEKKAMLEIVSNQLNRTEQQLTASITLDSQVSRIRLAVRALEIADRRVNELNTLALNLQPPTVSVLGAE
ncbi:MAG: hypothetical protein ACYS3S_15605 [Planctomycetota bacterium]|jgi:hypothetical protein